MTFDNSYYMDTIQIKIQELKQQLEELEVVRYKQEQDKIAQALRNDTLPNIHFQNIRNEIFKRQFGYWKKVQDNHYNIEKDAWKRKYASVDNFDTLYLTSYPDEILASIEDPPSFPNTLQQGGTDYQKHYRDNLNGNLITYHFISNKFTDPRHNTINPHINPTPTREFPVKDETLAAILFLLEDLSTRVIKLETTEPSTR